MTTLLVNELFETIQGEGAYTGTPAIFIRLQGCPVGCAWCDTKHTWDVIPEQQTTADVILLKSADAPSYFKATSVELMGIMRTQQYSARHIVITGGEPCMYDLRELTQIAKSMGFTTQIETSGTYQVLCDESTWVTVSPKINMKAGMPILSQAMQRADEIKHPIAMQKHIDELDTLLARHKIADPSAQLNTTKKSPNIYLQPISQQSRATELAVKTCIKRNWRLSIQLHKYIGVE